MADKWVARLRSFGHFLIYLKDQFVRDSCTRTAAALAYTTMLSLVPLLAVVFVTLAAFPGFQDLSYDIQGYLFENFVPDFGFAVQEHLSNFASQASRLRAVGIVFLILVVLTMMFTIDAAFNRIWRVRTRRSHAINFLVYWAVLTLGPLLIGVGVVATSYVVSLPLLAEVDSSLGLQERLFLAMPFLTSTLAFVLFYKFIPNTFVPLRHALIGGIVASVLFEMAKRGFALYVTNFPTQQAIYGAFASVPIFLIWIYLSWVVVLLGAEITRCLTSFGTRSDQSEEDRFAGLFEDVFRLVARLWEARRQGRALTTAEILELEPDIGLGRLEWLVEHLHKARWLQRSDDGEWILNRDLGQESLLNLLAILPGYRLTSRRRSESPLSASLEPLLNRYQRMLEEVFSVSVRELLEPNAELVDLDSRGEQRT